MTDPLIGRELGGAFVVESPLGAGGMGAVYVARHKRTGKTYAVKVLRPEHGAKSDEAAARFQREAAALAELNHPGIVAIQDFARTEDGIDFLVMDLLEGEDLSDRLARVGRLPRDEALRIFHETAVALMIAHDAGIVHRDLKPGNVFLRSARGAPDRAMILDFGLARMAESPEAQRLTASGVAMGTPLYMAPEQAAGERVGRAADQYALGVMLYEMLSGEPPFTGPSAPALLVKVLTTEAPTLASLGAAGPQISAAVARAMAKDPQQRFETVERFLAAVEGQPLMETRAVQSAPIAATRAVPSAPAVGARGSGMTRATVKLERSAPLVAAVAGLAVLALVGTALLWRLMSREVSVSVSDVRTPGVDGGGTAAPAREIRITSTAGLGVGAVPSDAGAHDAGAADAGGAQDASADKQDAGAAVGTERPRLGRRRPRRRHGSEPERGAHPANAPRLGPPPPGPDSQGRAELEASAHASSEAANRVHEMLTAVTRVERQLDTLRRGGRPPFCRVGGLELPSSHSSSAVVSARRDLVRGVQRACEASQGDTATREIAARALQNDIDRIISRLRQTERQLQREAQLSRATGG